MTQPLAIDLYCGLGGWSEALIAAGYYVVGFDIERHQYGDHRYPGQLVIQDVTMLHGSQFSDAALIVASPPCQEYSYMAMPWKLAKAKAAAIRADTTGAALAKLTRLFDTCFRIQNEASIAAGRRIPLIVENVKGAQAWVGRARWAFGSFYLWGDVPALMPFTFRGRKLASFRFDGSGRSFQSASVEQSGVKAPGMNWSDRTRRGQDFTRLAGVEAIKNSGGSWFNIGSPGQKSTNQNPIHALANEGIKQRGSGREWFAGEGKISRVTSSKSPAGKAASALIAKIPMPLAQHIAAVFHPERAA